MALYQTQPDRNLRAKALAKEYGIGGHSHDFLDGSSGFVNHDWKGLEFDHYPDHQKITLKWAQVEQYIDLMVQSDRYLTDREKEHYTPPAPVSAEPDATLTHYMNREYAYSRDKGKCKCCGNAFSPMLQKNCHHVKNKLPLDRINKVPNLVWLCEPCHRMVHNSPIPPELNAKTVGKIMKYREKLKT